MTSSINKQTPNKKADGDARRSKTVRQTTPSFNRTSYTSKEDLQRYRSISAPHVESYNYFLDHGLQLGVSDIEPEEVELIDPTNTDPSMFIHSNSTNEEEDKEDDDDDVEMGGGDEEKKIEEIDSVRFWVENVQISPPCKEVPGKGMKKMYPRECRELGFVYAGIISGDFCYQAIHKSVKTGKELNQSRIQRFHKRFGEMPIMVGSNKCHLYNLSAKELVDRKEEDNEIGGYFIVNGNERVIRMLQVTKRNHPIGLVRSSYTKRGPAYSDLGVTIRCANHNGDQSTITNTLHYLTTGAITLRFTMRKQEFLVPVVIIMRALSTVTDEELYYRMTQGESSNTFICARAQLLLEDARRFKAYSQTEALTFLGSKFRYLAGKGNLVTVSDEEVGLYVLRRYVLIHLQNFDDKLECLLLMLRKLYAIASGKCNPDNADSLQNQELLTAGHLMSMFMKEKFVEMLRNVSLAISKEMRDNNYQKVMLDVQTSRYWTRMLDRHGPLSGSAGLGSSANYLLSTGNIRSSTGLDLMQQAGFTIVAEKINFLRYLSHFRGVHRGQFFTTMRSTAIRKLLPDQWGFLCPVHTPDGGPCGLLSHLALHCELVAGPESKQEVHDLEQLLFSFGMSPVSRGNQGSGATQTAAYIVICLDGRVIGAASPNLARIIAIRLRQLKVDGHVPATLEVAYMPPPVSGGNGPYPGLYLATSAARMIRPVLHRASGKMEYIGPMEQPFLDIACLEADIREGITTHQELDPNNMLSLIASLTPFSDYNQSPRNMYQCQMAKQTMGTPCHNLTYRVDNKLFRRHDVQSPVVQTSRFGDYKMDEYPNGCNAVVAVLSYTGFDMEDAMIICKNSYGRGFGHGSVYKNVVVNLEDESKMAGRSDEAKPQMRFSNIKPPNHERINRMIVWDASQDKQGNKRILDPSKSHLIRESLDVDGLPMVGTKLVEGDPLYCLVDELSGKAKIGCYKEKEPAIVQQVRRMATSRATTSGRGSGSTAHLQEKVHIVLRIPRNPVIGDKFSSRHGQKGVLSILWSQEDMPFTESGVCPDVIINPHAFPSRMTIGMLIESMAGKSGALHGIYQDATPFTFHETGDKLAVDHFGEQLQAAGYHYYGSEPLYSGVSGQLLQADLYIGIVYYQRLRHMVSDKFQVRSTGKRNPLTRQPVGGRKVGGGIRLGEMERDSLLSHGAAFILLDRLLDCSDKSIGYACSRCGDLLSPCTERNVVLSAGQSASEALNHSRLRVFCRNEKCRSSSSDGTTGTSSSDDAVQPIVLPFVYRYLCNELAAMNIKMTCKIG